MLMLMMIGIMDSIDTGIVWMVSERFVVIVVDMGR